jgi:hypothetical protein
MNYIIKQLHHLNNMKFLTILTFLFLSGASAFAESSVDAKEKFLITVTRFESAILKLNKHIDKKNATRLGTLIAIESKKRHIDPRVFLAIINTESSFNQKALGKNIDKKTKKVTSIDISLAQINSKAWAPERFKSKTGKNLDPKKLKENDSYAIWAMGEILSHLKPDSSKKSKFKDKWWFANYHSYTPEYKKEYISSLMKSFRQLKPFGRDLLKDMPEIDQLVAISNKRNEIEIASFKGGTYEFEN